MESERIFSADQIVVHPELAKIIREYAKSVVRANPSDLESYSAEYFKKKCEVEEQRKTAEYLKAVEEQSALKKE